MTHQNMLRRQGKNGLVELTKLIGLNQWDKRCLRVLTERQKYVIIRYYFDYWTLAEIGREFRVTPDRVKQIRNKALQKMRLKDSRE